jgi:allantoicase
MTDPECAVTFTGLVDLASATLGGQALASSDEFFAEAGNLIQPGRGVFMEGRFTDRGKWMDGWESRRRRASATESPVGAAADDHDWCIVRLGAPGEVVGFDVDTHHFVGNHPPFASIDGLFAPGATPAAELVRRPWTPLLAQAALRPGSQNLFGAAASGPVSHVRLNIFPDGGVARLRVLGRVTPPWDAAGDALDAETQRHVTAGLHDLAAVKNGGVALACSDAFFGPMNNLLLPGRAADMGGGWETRRRRGPGHDWILVQLGARGALEVIEVDTNHFKGNYPQRFSLDAIDAPAGVRITDLIASRAWSTVVPETALGPHARHFFGGLAAAAAGTASHLRLNIFPDGGVSRLRAWGRRR